MKKFYLVTILVAFAGFTIAQNRTSVSKSVTIPKVEVQKSENSLKGVDTLRSHLSLYLGHTATIYSSTGGGFVAGQNGYGDIAKAQKFDATYGVTSGGTIDALLYWFGAKKQAAGTAIIIPTIWADNSGTPGSILGTGTAITVAQIDTSLAAYQLIGPASAPDAAYDVSATFSPSVTIPVNQIFWAGFTMTNVSGDSVGLVTSTDAAPGDAPGTTGDFPDATTHTFEQWSDNSWYSFNDGTTNTWMLDVAMGVYPVVNHTVVGISEDFFNNGIKLDQNQPNPATNATLIRYEIQNNASVSLEIYDITGRLVLSYDEGKQLAGKHNILVDSDKLMKGTYFYSLKADNQRLTKKMIITQ